MSRPWWLQAHPSRATRIEAGPLGLRPRLVPEDAKTIADELALRRPGFTPDWAPVEGLDGGAALVKLFGEQAALIAHRLNQLPDKAKVEFYRSAGIEPLGMRPAEAIVEFTVASAAPESVPIPVGFQVSAKAADGTQAQVIFETQEQVYATSAKLAALQVESGASSFALPVPQGDDAGGVLPFGPEPQVGNGLRIGLSGPTAPTQGLTLGFRFASADETPPPHVAGGIAPAPAAAVPLLQWDLVGVNGFDTLEVLRDETRSFTASGLVELRLPARWEALAPADKPRYWLRVRVVQGQFATPPRLTALRLNAARVRAVRTIHDEIAEPIAASNPPRMRLTQRPVLPGSVVVDVDEEANAARIRWHEVADLADSGPEDRVFSLDAARGELVFGNGVHGRSVPEGVRNVHVVKYQAPSGKAGKVAAGAIRGLVQSAAFLTGVNNPWPASGGADAENARSTVRTAPRNLTSRGRAVAANDYGILALAAPGAEVRRAYALPGRHPKYPGRFLPGVVGIVIVPPAPAQGPPMPDEAALDAVARHLAKTVALAGVEIAVGAPRFCRIRAEVGFLADPARSIAELMRQIIETINTFVDPLVGGAGGDGWPFGQPLEFHALERRLLGTVDGLRSIPKLRLSLDGVPQEMCVDVPLGPAELFWPGQHRVYPYPAEANP